MVKGLTVVLVCLLSGCYDPAVRENILFMGDSIAQEIVDDFGFTMLRRDGAPMIVNNSIGGAMQCQRQFVPVSQCVKLTARHQSL